MTIEQIKKEAMSLTHEEKVRLADELIASLDPAEQRRIDEAWANEIERRIDDLDAGRTTTRPIEDVIRDIRERLA